MTESYGYLPLHIPEVHEELVEDYDIQDEATDIVNFEFGDDLKRMDAYLRYELAHMLGCHCLGCISSFTEHVQELYNQTRIPNEDTGGMEQSVLQQYIHLQYGIKVTK